MFGKIAGGLAVLAVMAGCSVAQAAPAPKTASKVATAEWTGTHNLSADAAWDAVASTPEAAPMPLPARWDCSQPMTITVAAGPGVDEAKIRAELAYPVAYLNALGYTAQVQGATPYQPGMGAPDAAGSVIVAATNNPSDDAELVDSRAISMMKQAGSSNTAAAIVVDAKRGLASDIILHELGHVLGLDHKDGTVMAAEGQAPTTFDAAETASVRCS